MKKFLYYATTIAVALIGGNFLNTQGSADSVSTAQVRGNSSQLHLIESSIFYKGSFEGDIYKGQSPLPMIVLRGTTIKPRSFVIDINGGFFSKGNRYPLKINVVNLTTGEHITSFELSPGHVSAWGGIGENVDKDDFVGLYIESTSVKHHIRVDAELCTYWPVPPTISLN